VTKPVQQQMVVWVIVKGELIIFSTS